MIIRILEFKKLSHLEVENVANSLPEQQAMKQKRVLGKKAK